MSPPDVQPVDFTKYFNIVDGQPRTSKQQYYGIDPVTKENLWGAPVATEQDIEDAVAAANRAYSEWRYTTWEYRKERLTRFKDAANQYLTELTNLLIKEGGKPHALAAFEVHWLNQIIDWHLGLDEPKGTTNEDDENTIENIYVPLGVAVGICPWNGPLAIPVAKIVPAILMGNAVIVKPSPFTPYTGLKIVEIAQQAFPPGLVQGLSGDNSLGPALVDHPDIQKISFTGSTATGKRILAAAAKTVKRVTLEMGGNDPAIVLPDADLAKAGPRLAMGAFFNTGQICVASKRIYVHSSIYKDFLAAFIEATKALKVGSPAEDGVIIGPLQNEMQYNKVKNLFADTKSKDYTIAHGSADVSESKGYFINPTIIDNPPDDARAVTEEAFGPIVPVQSYDDLDDVIHRANNVKVGLGASVYGSDPKKTREVADRIESGMVAINSPPRPVLPGQFGGVKESGLGTEFGTLGILAYANVKCIVTAKN